MAAVIVGVNGTFKTANVLSAAMVLRVFMGPVLSWHVSQHSVKRVGPLACLIRLIVARSWPFRAYRTMSMYPL